MRQYFFYVLLLSISSTFADVEPDSFSQEAQERKKYLDPGIGVQDQFVNPAFNQEFCEFVLSTAPAEIMEKIKLINNPFCPDELRPRRIILVGPSGSGKTTLAQIIGYYSLRPVVYINAGMLGNEFKNSAVQNLRRAIEPYVNSSCIIILDEIDCLLKQSQNDRNPDVDLPKQVWEMFDICAQFPKITLIGITNDISGIPDPLKTRLAGDIIEVPLVDSLERRKSIVEFYLNKTTHLCNDAEISTIVQRSQDLSHRELERVIKEAHSYAFLRDQFSTKIKINDLEKAFEKIRRNRKLLNKINWKDYEKHFQYGTQFSGVLVSCIGIAVSAYMAYLSLKVSKDGLEYSKKQGKRSFKQADDHFEKNYALNKLLAERNHRQTVASQLMQKVYAILPKFIHNDGFHYEIDVEKYSIFNNERHSTETSDAAEEIYDNGRKVLRSLRNGTFEQLVDEATKSGKTYV